MAEGPVLVVSSEEVSGRKIVKALGLVRGHSVRARNLGRGPSGRRSRYRWRKGGSLRGASGGESRRGD